MSITGDEMAARIIAELVSRGRLHHADASDVDHDRRVVARILKECLRDAWRRSISPGPIAATLDEIELDPYHPTDQEHRAQQELLEALEQRKTDPGGWNEAISAGLVTIKFDPPGSPGADDL